MRLLRLALLTLLIATPAIAQPTATITLHVTGRTGPVAQADIAAGPVTTVTDEHGDARLTVPPGAVELRISRFGFEGATRKVTVAAGATLALAIELEEESVVDEDVVVTSTRTDRRVEDLPIRVEVIPQEEIEEKMAMRPGDVAMMLTETNGLRVQTASPALGTASIRVRGLGGRYTQLLADGLPLYGSLGNISLLQIAPMDLSRVEIIKGVGSALYGASSLGGVINLISKQPKAGAPERELILNRTSQGGTDSGLWYSAKPADHWGYSVLAGGHWQDRQDTNNDGWTDIPTYQRGTVRPRVQWADGAGRSLFATFGLMGEHRRGGSLPGTVAPDGRAFPEELSTRRLDGGAVARLLAGSRLVTLRASASGLWHDLQTGATRERDLHGTSFGEASMSGTSGKQTWVAGAAWQFEHYRATDVAGMDYSYAIPGVFVQDDYPLASWLTLSGSGRVDHHSVAGTFFSPRGSALARLGHGFILRASSGGGFSSPSPFTDETESAGLARVVLPRPLQAERAHSTSLDTAWNNPWLELNLSVFQSAISHPITVLDATDGRHIDVVNAPGPVRTTGTEFLGRIHKGKSDFVATHVFAWATEAPVSEATRREQALTPRHTFSLDWLWDIPGRGRLGIETFYTGRQRLYDDPAFRRSKPYMLWGVVGEVRAGRHLRVFYNAENITNVRMTDTQPLVRPAQAASGRWTTDVWGPLEGRAINVGTRVAF